MNDICVIVVAMNAERTVARAVASALAEREVREVVVIDDASRDATVAAARSADDGSGRLSIHRNRSALGIAASRNLALARSSAPLVTVLDADDVILPGRFAAMADPQGDWDMSADNIMFVAEQEAAGMTGLAAFDTGGVAEQMSFARFVEASILQPGDARGELAFLKPVMRRSFLERHGLAYDEKRRLGRDFDLYARMLLAGARFRLVATCGYLAIESPAAPGAHYAAADLAALVAADDRMLMRPLKPADRAILALHRAHYAKRWHHLHFVETRQKSGLISALMAHRDRPRLLLDAGLGVVRDKIALLLPKGVPPPRHRFLIAP